MILSLSSAVAALGLATAVAQGGRGTLRVVTRGYETTEGHALLALCASAEDFDSRDRALRYGKVKPADGSAVFSFEDLPAGEYAIKVFQDADGDQELDVGLFGPEEAYGFSNGARGTFGPPSWQDARFRFAGGDETVEITVD
jgi:uncharacterized protein (DUF2141 family)